MKNFNEIVKIEVFVDINRTPQTTYEVCIKGTKGKNPVFVGSCHTIKTANELKKQIVSELENRSVRLREMQARMDNNPFWFEQREALNV